MRRWRLDPNLEALRFASFTLHTLPQAEGSAESVSARALQRFTAEDVDPNSSATYLLQQHKSAQPQTRQTQLAEPIKYSKTIAQRQQR